MVRTLDSKDLLVQRSGYTIRLEYSKDYVIVHLRGIEKFTKEVFLDMVEQLKVWSDFLKEMGQAYLWAAVPSDNDKIKRLLGGLKFRFVGREGELSIYRYGG